MNEVQMTNGRKVLDRVIGVIGVIDQANSFKMYSNTSRTEGEKGLLH